MTEPQTPEPEVNVEAIMQQIRQQIIAKRAAVSDGGTSTIVVSGKRFPPEFYEHLYRAQLALDDYQVPVFVSKSSTPLVGGLIDWFRTKLHELVTYYVNESAARQVNASAHLLQALSLLSRELENTDDDPA